MIQQLIHFSIHNKLIVMLGTLALVIWGTVSLSNLPLDAIPDVTNNQVVVATQSPNLSAIEMEQFVTYPIEMAMRNIQGLEGIRSVSQFGLSIVTLNFKEHVDLYFARNQVNERLQTIRQDIPSGFGVPTMNPITTGLGEIYQYTIRPTDPADTSWSPLELRTVQDWVVKKQLLGTEGIAEVSSFGGYLKQYHVRVDPQLLRATQSTLAEVFEAVAQGNENTGAAYLEKDAHNYFIRGIGLANSPEDLQRAVVRVNGGTPVLVRDVAQVEVGSAVRYGALTQGKKEAVGGIVLMLKGENSRNVILNIKERLKTLQLPKGLTIDPFLDRELLIDRTIATVSRNLLEGGLIVIFVLVLLLGHLRAGLVVASVIPLSMLFAIGCMVAFDVSGNLMSLGAIDFGLIVDGAVIIVENIITQLIARETHQQTEEVPHLPGVSPRAHLTHEQTIGRAATSMANSSFFGQMIILIVYVPLLTLSGIEGKMFKPMALTVIFALTGAVLLSLTYVPALSALAFKGKISHGQTFADRLMHALERVYKPSLEWALARKPLVLALSGALLVVAGWLFSRMGGEFIPQLDEGDYAIEVRMLPGSSLNAMVGSAERVATAIQGHFPDEVRLCTGKIGTSEVPMDPMSMEEMDMMLTMNPREQWKKVKTRAEFEAELQKVLDEVPGVFTSIQQPISMRFNELMSGAKTDVIVQVLGNDLERLADMGNEVVHQVNRIPGAQDVSMAKAEGLPQLFVEYRRDALARYGLSISALNTTLQTALAGQKAGTFFEENQRFDVVVKLRTDPLRQLENLNNLQVATPIGMTVPLAELADIRIKEGPMAVNRVDGERCVNVALNVRGRDIQSVVADVQQAVSKHVALPDGYRITYGGQFENLRSAQARLAIVVPAALLLILLLLYFSFGSIRESLLIFSAIPFAAVGGVLALWLRDMPFSISAGVGFIALFGVAVLNGMVLIGYFQQLQREGVDDAHLRIRQGVLARFRPVVMTASVASLGFLPMALASGAGAEVQKPLATVVIGGLISATLLTLVILPVLYAVFSQTPARHGGRAAALPLLLLLTGGFWGVNALHAQSTLSEQQAVANALSRHPALLKAAHQVEEKAVLSQSNMPLPALQAYTWLPFNPEVGMIQSFNPPALVRADRKVREGQLALSGAARQLTQLQVEREVRLAYEHCRYARERAQLMARQDSTLADYLRVAEAEFRTGNISALTRLHTESRSHEARRMSVAAQLDYRAARRALQLAALLEDTTWQVPGELTQRAFAPALTDLTEAWGTQLQEVAALEWARERKTMRPGFGVGVVANVDPKNRFLPNAYFSLNVPLFRKGQRAAAEAARIRQTLAADEVADIRRSAQMRAQHWMAQWEAAHNDLVYWGKTGSTQAAELLRAAALTRQAGETNTTEYLQAISQAYTLQLNHLDALWRLNEAVIYLDFRTVPEAW